MEDAQIVELYWQRSEQAIAASQQQYGSYCRAIAHNILHTPEDSEECVNDTWLNAWNTIPPQAPRRLRVFLGRITRNLALNRWKHSHTKKRGGSQAELALAELEECVPAADNTAKAVEDAELARALQQFLWAQPELKRSIFLRRYWYLMPIKEIAAACRMSESKVTALLHRMRQQLKTALEKEGITL